MIKLQTFREKVGEFLFKTWLKVKDSEKIMEEKTKNFHFFFIENQRINEKSDRMKAFFIKIFWQNKYFYVTLHRIPTTEKLKWK